LWFADNSSVTFPDGGMRMQPPSERDVAAVCAARWAVVSGDVVRLHLLDHDCGSCSAPAHHAVADDI
jgi:hypothetical protein